MNSCADNTTVLVIGCGNPLRGDDGLGWRAAAALRPCPPPGTTIITCHQLLPELAELLSRAALVILIDASAADPPGLIRCAPVAPPDIKGDAASFRAPQTKGQTKGDVANYGAQIKRDVASYRPSGAPTPIKGDVASCNESGAPEAPTPPAPAPLAHHLGLAALLAWARALYGHAPRAVALSVGAASFDFTEELSAPVAAALPALIQRVRPLAAAEADARPAPCPVPASA